MTPPPTIESIARTQDKTLLVVEHLAEKVAERIEYTDEWRLRTDLIIMGDGNGRKGHNVRIDRLEQTYASQRWLVRLMCSGLAIVLLERLLSAGVW